MTEASLRYVRSAISSTLSNFGGFILPVWLMFTVLTYFEYIHTESSKPTHECMT